MTTTIPRARRSTSAPRPARRGDASRAEVLTPTASCCASRRHSARASSVLASYIDELGRMREVLSFGGAHGSRLVIDRDRLTSGDRRLVAHLAADEPTENARIVCELYVGDECKRCRQATVEDLRNPALLGLGGRGSAAGRSGCRLDCEAAQDAAGNRYRLSPVAVRIATPELRWCRTIGTASAPEQPVSIRDVVGALQSYEPIRALSAAAIDRHREDRRLSVATLGIELERLNASRTVLNRGLREAVLGAVERGDVSMSEIALRCGRVKRDRRGVLSGETTWLARRLGLVCEGGAPAPSPWVHSNVLALIARRGLCIAPREVELG